MIALPEIGSMPVRSTSFQPNIVLYQQMQTLTAGKQTQDPASVGIRLNVGRWPHRMAGNQQVHLATSEPALAGKMNMLDLLRPALIRQPARRNSHQRSDFINRVQQQIAGSARSLANSRTRLQRHEPQFGNLAHPVTPG